MTNDKMHAAMKDGKLKRGGDFNQDECWGYERGFSDAWQAATEHAATTARRKALWHGLCDDAAEDIAAAIRKG